MFSPLGIFVFGVVVAVVLTALALRGATERRMAERHAAERERERRSKLRVLRGRQVILVARDFQGRSSDLESFLDSAFVDAGAQVDTLCRAVKDWLWTDTAAAVCNPRIDVESDTVLLRFAVDVRPRREGSQLHIVCRLHERGGVLRAQRTLDYPWRHSDRNETYERVSQDLVVLVTELLEESGLAKRAAVQTSIPSATDSLPA